MTVIADVLKELFSMFVSDARLTVAVLALVALIAVSIKWVPDANPLLAGYSLLGGCLTIIITTTTLHARRAQRNQRK